MAVRTSPGLGMMYGQDAQLKKYWLDIDYPYRAPPLYERSGYVPLPPDLRGPKTVFLTWQTAY